MAIAKKISIYAFFILVCALSNYVNAVDDEYDTYFHWGSAGILKQIEAQGYMTVPMWLFWKQSGAGSGALGEGLYVSRNIYDSSEFANKKEPYVTVVRVKRGAGVELEMIGEEGDGHDWWVIRRPHAYPDGEIVIRTVKATDFDLIEAKNFINNHFQYENGKQVRINMYLSCVTYGDPSCCIIL
jgi:hypothetical protein